MVQLVFQCCKLEWKQWCRWLGGATISLCV